MKVLVTGTEATSAACSRPSCSRDGHEVVGVDTGFYKHGWLYNGVDAHRRTRWPRTSATSTADDLEGFDAIVHMAELSNDPLGSAVADDHLRDQPPGLGAPGRAGQAGRGRAVRLHVVVQRLRRGRRATSTRRRRQPADRVRRVQGAGRARRAGPGRRRLLADLPAQRHRLRRLAAHAVRHRAEQPAGLAWTTEADRHDQRRHALAAARARLDIAKAIRCVLDAPARASCTTRSSTSATASRTTRCARSPRSSATAFPGCELSFGDAGGDNRSYRVSFDKIHDKLPGLRVRLGRRRGARSSCTRSSAHRPGRRDLHRPRPHPAQAAPAPDRHRPARRRAVLERRRDHHRAPPSRASPSSTSSGARTTAASSPGRSASTSSAPPA